MRRACSEQRVRVGVDRLGIHEGATHFIVRDGALRFPPCYDVVKDATTYHSFSISWR